MEVLFRRHLISFVKAGSVLLYWLVSCFEPPKSVFQIMLVEDELNTYHFVKIKCITLAF